MYRFYLLMDDTFRELNIPISPEARKELNRKILKGEPVDPVIEWNGYIVTGYEQDEICMKYRKYVFSKAMKFPRKTDAIAWLCREQLKRTDLTWAAKAWLISRLYEALREIAKRRSSKENFQYRQLSPSPGVSKGTDPHFEDMNILIRLGEDSRHKDTIRRYVHYGRQLDRLDESFPGTRVRILTGELEVLISHLPALLKMPGEKLEKMLCDRHITKLIPPREYLPPEKKKKRNEKRRKPVIRIEPGKQPGIKQMPQYDPDAELNGLRYTVSTWKKAVERAAAKPDLGNATTAVKYSLKQELDKLISEAKYLYGKLEETQDD